MGQTQGPPKPFAVVWLGGAEAREHQARRADALLDPTTALDLSEELCELNPALFREEAPIRKREVDGRARRGRSCENVWDGNVAPKASAESLAKGRRGRHAGETSLISMQLLA
ncbi:MAG TPA: hypothetical protein VG937_13285 [Polyangiaceae bacterium]|nr:hypothetical protein [Polyangiaceae bacterium]